MLNDHELKEEMSDEEAFRRSNKPVCFNFLVMPVVPEEVGTLLDSDGKPVATDYHKVNWKNVAKAFQSRLDGKLPKAVKVYVANDGPDLFDINEFSYENPENEGTVNGFVYRVSDALKGVSISNYRGGVLKLQANSGLHLNPPPGGGKRPPLAGMIVAIKFSNMFQVIDYFSYATERLWGLSFAMPAEPLSLPCSDETYGEMPEEVHAWLEDEFGAVYSDKCGALFLSCTFSD